jgi:hypothetical protein
MKKILLLVLILSSCSGGDQKLFSTLEGRWLEKTSKQLFFEEWHPLDREVWGGFSYGLPKKELARIKRMRTFQIKKWNEHWIFIEINADTKMADTLVLQPSEEPDTWIFKKDEREEMIRLDGKELTRNSIFPESSVLHHLKNYQPKNETEELPYSLLKN